MECYVLGSTNLEHLCKTFSQFILSVHYNRVDSAISIIQTFPALPFNFHSLLRSRHPTALLRLQPWFVIIHHKHQKLKKVYVL